MFAPGSRHLLEVDKTGEPVTPLRVLKVANDAAKEQGSPGSMERLSPVTA